MRVQNKQVEELEDFFNKTVVKAEVVDNIVTLKRADGQTFSFSIANQDAPDGLPGDKGDDGDKGDSAYDVYARNGGELSEEAWVNSLKGPTGPQGDPGDDGVDGVDGVSGITPTISGGTISVDNTLTDPTVTISEEDNQYTLHFVVPEGPKGVKGFPAIDKEIKVGTIATVDIPPYGVKISESIDETFLNFTLLRGAHGRDGKDAIATNGISPDVTLSVNMISENLMPSVTKTVEDDTWHLTLNIPKGPKGESGPQGKEGKRASINPDIQYINITDNEGLINAPDFNSFRPITFKIGDIRFFGWSLRGPDTVEYNYGKIVQCAVNEDISLSIIRTKDNRNVFGFIDEGWIPNNEIKGMGW